MKEKTTKLKLERLLIRHWGHNEIDYKGEVTFSNKDLSFETTLSDDACKKMILLISDEIRNAKNTLADDLEIAISETIR